MMERDICHNVYYLSLTEKNCNVANGTRNTEGSLANEGIFGKKAFYFVNVDS